MNLNEMIIISCYFEWLDNLQCFPLQIKQYNIEKHFIVKLK